MKAMALYALGGLAYYIWKGHELKNMDEVNHFRDDIQNTFDVEYSDHEFMTCVRLGRIFGSLIWPLTVLANLIFSTIEVVSKKSTEKREGE